MNKIKIRKTICKYILICILTISNYITAYANDSTPAVSNYSFIIIDGNISQDYYESIIHEYIKCPKNIRENFQLNGWKIIITDKDLDSLLYNGKYGQGGVLASTNAETKLVHISTDPMAVSSVCHEIGHFVNYAINGLSNPLSNTKEWKSLCDLNGDYISWFGTKQYSERLADTFCMYCQDKELLKKTNSDAYSLMVQYVNQILGV